VTIAVVMSTVAFVAVALIAVVLWDAFEAIVLPRRVTRKWRMARLFYRTTWLLMPLPAWTSSRASSTRTPADD